MKYLQDINSGKYYYIRYVDDTEHWCGILVDDIEFASGFSYDDWTLHYIIADLTDDLHSIKIVKLKL